MTTQQHTPTPWRAGINGALIMARTNTIQVGCTGSLNPNFRAKDPNADAAFIVRACNAHDALVAALEYALQIIEHPTVSSRKAITQAREAIKLARGES